MGSDHSSEYRRCLDELDVAGMIRLHHVVQPHLPAPENEAEALASLHLARTQARSIAREKRFYSHRWLTDRGYPSALPDELKPPAERMFPVTVAAVGISVNAQSELFRPIVPYVREAMQDAVLEAEADGRLTDSQHVKSRMADAKRATVRRLIGKLH